MSHSILRFLPLILTLLLWQCSSANDLINYLIPQAPDPCLNAGSVSSPFECGSGTRDDPYRISQASQLEALGRDIPNSDMYYSAHFWLANSIDMEGIAMSPIGGGTAINFTGSFDGSGHVIENLTINLSGQDEVGLFGVIGAGAVLRDLALDGVSISGQDDVGALVGFNEGGRISNAYVKTSETGSVMGGDNIGGLVGRNLNMSSISNSYAEASVTGDNAVGGLVGLNSNASVFNCYTTGAVRGMSNQIGGLVGLNEMNSTISSSFASGDVTGMGNQVGGLVGQNNVASVSNSYATGNVEGNDDVGGLVGNNDNSNISNSYATGNIDDGNDNVGGLVGRNSNSNVNNSYATGNIKGNDIIGGLIGTNFSSSDISNSYTTGSVEGMDFVGGFVGINNGSTINDSYAAGSVMGINNIGGFVGVNITGGTISGFNYFVDSDGGGDGVGGTGTCTGTCAIRTTDQLPSYTNLNNLPAWDPKHWYFPSSELYPVVKYGPYDADRSGSINPPNEGCGRLPTQARCSFTRLPDQRDNDRDGVYNISDACLSDIEGLPNPNPMAPDGDPDNDGCKNEEDDDDDNDGVDDGSDAFPVDPTETIDTDGDGTGNNADMDDDNDLVPDSSDICPLGDIGPPNANNMAPDGDPDGDGCKNNEDIDDDNDGVDDGSDTFPFDPTETIDTDGDGTGNDADLDDDGDGLFEISTLDQLNDMRNSLDGTMLGGSNTGCPGTTPACNGYELTADLDFDEDGDGTDNDTYTMGNGWIPIGDNSTTDIMSRFSATFDGNGHTITNLYVDLSVNGDARAGLFGYIQTAVIRNIGLKDVDVTSVNTSTSGISDSGGLAGRGLASSITNSYVTGQVSSDSDSSSNAGGLVGYNGEFGGTTGRITNSYAAASVVTTSSGFSSNSGGLAAQNINSIITNCYATGSTNSMTTSGAPNADSGGLVGFHAGSANSIMNSYATGSATSTVSSGTDANSAGLVGLNAGGTISSSFWDRNTASLQEDDGAGTFTTIVTDTTVGDIGAGGNDGARGHTGVTSLTSVEMMATGGAITGLGNAFDLSTASQYPRVRYGGTPGTDCEITGADPNVNEGGELPDCGDLLPGQ